MGKLKLKRPVAKKVSGGRAPTPAEEVPVRAPVKKLTRPKNPLVPRPASKTTSKTTQKTTPKGEPTVAKIEKLIDDLDGTEDEGIETLRFSIDTDFYEIDLNPVNYKNFIEDNQVYVDVARKLPASAVAAARARSGRGKAKSSSEATTPEENQQIREWANANGYETGGRGRIKKEIKEAYYAAQAPASE